MPSQQKTLSLSDLAAANALLVSMGAEDQMPRIAAVSVESRIELQHRIDRALAYAAEVGASVHARNMARILDGSITIDDELNETDDADGPFHQVERTPTRAAARSIAAPPAKRPKGKLKPGNGLGGRTKAERLVIREWIAAQGYDIPQFGRIPQMYLDEYDKHQDLLRQHRAEESRRQRRAASEQDSLIPEE
jgi:hypothetical protein